jgi:hypothetical protein
MVVSGRLDREEPMPAFEPAQFVFVGSVEQEKDGRRIQREFAIWVTIERDEKRGQLGVLRIRQLHELGV